jgi:hypothetical protein
MTDLKPCGTVAAYMRHYRRGEEPCEECLQAKRDRYKQIDSDRVLARARASVRLRGEYPRRFQELVREELAK